MRVLGQKKLKRGEGAKRPPPCLGLKLCLGLFELEIHVFWKLFIFIHGFYAFLPYKKKLRVDLN